MITAQQIRAARGLKGWRVEDLAVHTGLTREALTRIEGEFVKHPHKGSLEKIRQAFAKENIEFLGQDGVRKHDGTLRVIEGENPYLQLLDDVFYTLKDGGEALFAHVSNRLSSKLVIESQLRMRRSGIKFRALICEGDNFCVFPLSEYRQIPSDFFENNTQIIYGEKVGSMINCNKNTLIDKKALIINNASFAQTQRCAFNLIWTLHHAPSTTIAPTTYA
jgi:transcriptional regulator with XRE-family HTH domain